jgi:hypothetical protein
MIAALIFISFETEAQTRRIAHRFHSGADGKKYQDVSSSYGIPMPQKPQKTIPIFWYDTIHMEDGRDSIVSRMDTLRLTPTPRRNQTRNQNVSSVNQLGSNYSTLTTR